MPTTSNFGWNTPADTDLVKDGALSIRTLGNNIDTSLVDLKGGTTGQVLTKATNTDLDYTWTTPQVGDITAVTAGTGLSGGGTSGDVTLTNTVATAYDAKGDLIVGTGADTFSRLASSGTNNDVLVVDTTTATGLKWAAPSAAGGWTELASGSLSGASVSISSIAGTYRHLQLIIRNYRPATDDTPMNLRLNNNSSSTYGGITTSMNGTNDSFSKTSMETIIQNADNGASSSFAIMTFEDYANSTTWKTVRSFSVTTNPTTTANFNWNNGLGFWNQTAAINRLDFFPASGNFTSGTYVLYGVK